MRGTDLSQVPRSYLDLPPDQGSCYYFCYLRCHHRLCHGTQSPEAEILIKMLEDNLKARNVSTIKHYDGLNTELLI